MAKRKVPFLNGEYYHIYNRGVDKRSIVSSTDDILRILESLDVFNTKESIGSIYENSFRKNNQLGNPVSKLVEVVAFNILDNHYHLVLKQVLEGGISKFMKSFGGGYTKHYNDKYKRSGILFQGPFKAVHIDSNEYLRYVVAYVNGNHYVHNLTKSISGWGMRSSFEQYVFNESEWKNKYFKCDVGIIMDHYKDREVYKKEVRAIAKIIREKRAEKDLTSLEF